MIRHIPLPIRFGHRHKRILYTVFALLWLSGALWLAFHYFLRAPGEFGDTAHPLEIWWLRLHGLMALAALVGVGSVLPVHAHRAWHLKRNRVSGLAVKVLMLWLAATGYALYYFVSESNEAWLPFLHWGIGLALPLMLAAHIRRGRARPTAVSNTAAHATPTHTQPANPAPARGARQPLNY